MTDPSVTGPIPDSSSHKASTLKNFAWAGGQNVAVRLLSLVTFVVLARLLTPHDYGVTAIAGVFGAVFSVFAAGGFSQALVQQPEIDHEDIDSVFWVSVTIAIVLTALTCAAAWPVAAFFHLPELKPVLWALSPMFLAIGFGSPQMGLLQRRFEFAKLARISVVGNLLATIVGVTVALLGGGYWALVVQMVLVPVITCAAVWRVSSYRPRASISREKFLNVFATSRQFMGFSFSNFFSEQFDKFVVGRELGTQVLGVYSVAYRIVFIMLNVASTSVQMVALPGFSRLQSDGARLKSSYLAGIRLIATISVPSFVFAAVNANDIVATLFGQQWLDSVPAMQILCAYAIGQSLLAYNSVFLQAIGGARTALRLSIMGAAFQTVAILSTVGFGVLWVAASFGVRVAIFGPISSALVSQRVGGGVSRQVFREIWPQVVACVCFACACLGLQAMDSVSSPFLSLIAEVATATIAYFVPLALLGPRHLAELRDLIKLLRGRSRSSTGTPDSVQT